jgi:hypothetical protein
MTLGGRGRGGGRSYMMLDKGTMSLSRENIVDCAVTAAVTKHNKYENVAIERKLEMMVPSWLFILVASLPTRVISF